MLRLNQSNRPFVASINLSISPFPFAAAVAATTPALALRGVLVRLYVETSKIDEASGGFMLPTEGGVQRACAGASSRAAVAG